ncbi:MAG: AAA family ATPase [Chloroflexi bacterium]|nr:AAA family ATPase [Chloroflexota bacterium]
MIRCVLVDGFKTLSKFKMELRPGLDILVGPNGSGKTNIISFFEFLGFLQDMNVADAISSAGGAGSIFKKVAENTYQAGIFANIVGSIRLGSKNYLYYDYLFDIRLQESGEGISYHRQRLSLKHRTVASIGQHKLGSYDLDIERSIDDDGNVATEVFACNTAKIKLNFPFRTKAGKGTIRDRIIQSLDMYVSPDDSIVSALRVIARPYANVMRDVRGGNVYNIEPSKAKVPDDSAKKPGVARDGSGLYSTLNAMQKGSAINREQALSQLRLLPQKRLDIGSATLSDVVEYVQLANDSIAGLEIVNNPFDRQLQIKVTISDSDDNDDPPVLPLSAMSDGTVKWIALITIILTNPTMFSVEEPENYLHPLMQTEIVSIMRSTLREERFILMSTHSETLLNSMKPDEIVVVSFEDGKTTAKRVSNADDLDSEIRNTGFGLGYYYIAGSFDHA